MIIWGSRATNSTVSSGPFHCPRCGPEKTYDLIKVARWFTLYFIPIFPIGDDGRYIKCRMCAGTFAPSAIHYDPVAANAEFMAKVDTALVRGLLLLAMAAPPATDDVLADIADIMERSRGRMITLESMRGLMSDVEKQKLTMKTVVGPIASSLTSEGGSMLIRILATDAQTMTPKQRALLEEAGSYLGFNKKAIEPLFVPALAN